MDRLELVEVEFLHPACLDPFSVLPSLQHLVIINPSIIGKIRQRQRGSTLFTLVNCPLFPFSIVVLLD